MRRLLAESARKAIGRSSVTAIRAAEFFLHRRPTRRLEVGSHSDELDRTGVCVAAPEHLEILWKDETVIFPLYESSLAHSLWRAQEFSLFMQHKMELRRPLLDFGCGDGSFAAVLFDEIEYGMDIDEQALELAAQFKIYGKLIKPEGLSIPLADGAVRSVFSNSVLEHVKNLDPFVREIGRVLTDGGTFMFTVPVAQFAKDLELYFGKAESRQVNADYFHRNLLESERWQEVLARNGLQVLSIRAYQPAWFTFYYMMLRFFGNRILGRIIPNIRRKVWQRYGRRMIEMVRKSISDGTASGGNIFIVAKKTGG